MLEYKRKGIFKGNIYFMKDKVRLAKIKEYRIKPEELEDQVDRFFSNLDNYEERLLSRRVIKYGQIVPGRVLRMDSNYVYINLGQKSDGYLSLSEFSPRQISELKPEDTLSVMVDDYDEENNLVVLSYKKAEREENWQKILNNQKEGEEIFGRIIRKVTNGYLVDVGIIGFLPLAHASDKRTDTDTENYINQELDFEILKIDQEKRNIILSRKKLIERNKRVMRQQMLENLRENDICEGLVKNITNYGAFIDLGGIDGLLHITDISWNRISTPKDVLELNQRIRVKILKIDSEKQRLSLGLKQLSQNPWKDVEKKYKVGSQVKATISEVGEGRISVKLDTGVESVIDLKDYEMGSLVVGEKVDVKIDHINTKTKKIDLSLVD